MYTENEAARLLDMPASTLHYWLEGSVRKGKIYQPIVRVHSTGNRNVTWAEFVEAALLRQYRQEHHVPMPQLRAFIDLLRDQLGVPYPLADQRPFVANRELVIRAQESAGLDAEYCLVAAVSGQLVLTYPSAEFFHRVTWQGDLPEQWQPHRELSSPVRINPNVRFGKPAIAGISTAILAEHARAGEAEDEIAEAFDLTLEQVRWGLSYESSRLAA